MDEFMKMEMLAEDNAEYDEVPFESNVENEFGNIDEVKEYGTFRLTEPDLIDHHIYSQADN